MRRQLRDKWSRLATIVVVLAWPGPSPAAAQTATDERVWTEISVHGHAGHDAAWHWTSDSLVRSRDGAGTLDLLAEGVLVSRSVTRRATVGVGYVYGAGFTERAIVREHKFLQQYAWSGGARPRVTLKSRVEERMASGQSDVAVRGRQQLRVMWPVAPRQGLYAVAWDELFVQLNRSSRLSPGFESNMAFVGFRRKVTEGSATEIGYLAVYSRTGSSRHLCSHVLAATLAITL